MIATIILTVIVTLIVLTCAGLALIATLTIKHLNNNQEES